MSISEFCTHNVVCATRDTTALEAARLMRHHHVGDVVIVDESDGVRKPIGIVTDRDLVVEVMASGVDPSAIKIGELVLRSPVIIEDSASYAETVRLMAVNGVRRMPVVGPGGALLGIITLDDMLRQLTSPLAALADLAGRARSFEAQTRA
ncbi:MAG TPA: CBS domain-containing protein [Casimicrobiaceae bacterium]|nr:CBS domain-containing protein [Casimicrobiaceae bacterium]